MAAQDIVTKEYMKDTVVFADAFNYFLYNGRQVIDPLKLHPMDTAEIGTPYGMGRSEAPVQKFRDGLKYWAAMEDERAAYMVLGIENQSRNHYAMPVKNMVYDALQYASQVGQAAKSYRKAVKGKGTFKGTGKFNGDIENEWSSFKWPSAEEYLSGFRKDDRLLPVVTLTILFAAEPWDGPMSIHEMLLVEDGKILSFVPDYRINLIAPAQIEAASMDKFKSSLREVLLYIKYSKDKERLRELLFTDGRFKHVERQAAVVINTVTNSGIKFEEGEGEVDLCLAIRELQQESWNEGEKNGKRIGEKRGIARINSLNMKLIETGRLEDLKRASLDLEYQAQLMRELLTDGE